MIEDEAEIHQVVAQWMTATSQNDVQTVLGLMTEDVIFMVPGREPFGKEEFAEALKSMGDARIEGSSDIIELYVFGDYAFTRNLVKMTILSPDGTPVHRSGFTQTLWRKDADSCWRIMRDANFVSEPT